jgi:hypothetical protein
MAEEPFLSRWSKRKTEARSGTASPDEPVAPPPPVAAPEPAVPEARAPLPPVESLTPESDFTGFMRPDVDGGLRSQALKALFKDPHYNVMDGLDIYISDYSLPDPIPESWLGQLKAMARLGAYEEPKVEEGAAEPGEASAAALEAPEKPSAVQGLAEPPSGNTSDTLEEEPAPPKMQE